MKTQSTDTAPWYRHRWPWLLALGPVCVVLAGFYTAYLAIKNPEAMVVDDYYREGKAINLQLKRDQRAKALELSAEIQLPNLENAELRLHGKIDQWPVLLTLNLNHATLADKDAVVTFARFREDGQGALYRATRSQTGRLFQPNEKGVWRLVLEDENKEWRLMNNINLPMETFKL